MKFRVGWRDTFHFFFKKRIQQLGHLIPSLKLVSFADKPRHVMSGLFFHSMFYLLVICRNLALLHKHMVSSLITRLLVPMKRIIFSLRPCCLSKMIYSCLQLRRTNEITRALFFWFPGCNSTNGAISREYKRGGNQGILSTSFCEQAGITSPLEDCLMLFCFLNPKSFSSTLTLHSKC